MSEVLFKRVMRLVSGNVGDAVDAIERAGGHVVMRQSLREIDSAIDDVRRALDHVKEEQCQLTGRLRLVDESTKDLTEKAIFALEQGREDLAEAAVTRQLELEDLRKKTNQRAHGLKSEQEKLDGCLVSLLERKRAMETEYAALGSALNAGGALTKSIDPRVDVGSAAVRKAEKAEDAFDRAMAHAGALVPDRQNIGKISAIEAIQRKTRTMERMAALKISQAERTRVE